jgi:hypothetical protein
MSSAVLSPVPAWGAVAREQFRSVGLALRREALAATGFVALATVWLAAMQSHSFGGVRLYPEAGVPAAMLALLVPMAVWKGEDPARRGYHRAMPVSHAAHAAARSLSGLAWTLAGVGAYFAWLGAMTAATGGQVRSESPYLWVVPFTAATVMYLLGSALTLATTHPWRWLGGGFVGYLFLGALPMGDGTRSLFDVVNTVVTGRYGFTTVISGQSPVPWRSYAHHADASVWLAATWLWLAMAVTLFAWAAYRQPER